jgi:hypothetical protein
MNTPQRTIRIEDELWTAAAAKAEKENTTVTDVIRKALDAYVKASAAVLVAVLAMFTLGACSADEPTTTSPTALGPSSSVLPTTRANPDGDVPPGERREILRRVRAGECFSTSFGRTGLEWAGWMENRPEPADGTAWESGFEKYLAKVPVGCTEADQSAIDEFLN